MKLIVLDIPEDGIDLHEEMDVRLGDDEGDAHTTASVSLSVSRSGDDVFVRGNIKAEVDAQCARCLTSFVEGLDFPFQMAFYLSDVEEHAQDDEEMELDEEDLNTGFYTGDTISLDELVKEQILLNMPIKALCSEDCKGICPECGADMNETSCGCADSKVDPRMEVLRGLLEKKTNAETRSK